MSTNLDSARAFYAAFASGDLPGALALMHDEIEWLEPVTVPYGCHTGKQPIVDNVLAKVMRDMPDFTVTPQEVVGEGDTVVGLGQYRGTCATTGRELDTPFAHVFHFRDGKIARFRTISDAHLWRYALGIDDTAA